MAILDERFLTPPNAITNPELVTAMYAVIKEDNEETRRALYTALAQSTLILPVAEALSESASPKAHTLSQDANLKLIAFEDDQGAPIFIAFTDENAVLAWQPQGTPYIAMDAPDLFAMATRHRVAELLINPTGPVSGRIGLADMAMLAQGQIPYATVTPPPVTQSAVGARVLISRPTAGVDDAWMRQLQDTLSNYPQVEQVYRFQVHIGQKAPRTILGLCFAAQTTAPEQDRVIGALLDEMQDVAPAPTKDNVLVLDDPVFLQTVQDTVEPLYSR